MNKAQAVLVNFQHQLSLSSYWGDGTTSSSDGMRVQIGVSSLHADANPHYGTGKGSTIYRFVSDQFSSFYTKVINTNARDAVHVIDGLLHHETDLHIEEHYIQTQQVIRTSIRTDEFVRIPVCSKTARPCGLKTLSI